MSIQINQKLDDFTLLSVKQQEISEFSLYEFLRQQQSQKADFKGFVLFFYPKDQSKCCITEVQSFAALYADFTVLLFAALQGGPILKRVKQK